MYNGRGIPAEDSVIHTITVCVPLALGLCLLQTRNLSEVFTLSVWASWLS